MPYDPNPSHRSSAVKEADLRVIVTTIEILAQSCYLSLLDAIEWRILEEKQKGTVGFDDEEYVIQIKLLHLITHLAGTDIRDFFWNSVHGTAASRLSGTFTPDQIWDLVIPIGFKALDKIKIELQKNYRVPAGGFCYPIPNLIRGIT